MSEAIKTIADDLDRNVSYWNSVTTERHTRLQYRTDSKDIRVTIPHENAEYDSEVNVVKWGGKKVQYRASLYYAAEFGEVENLVLGSRVEKTLNKLFSVI